MKLRKLLVSLIMVAMVFSTTACNAQNGDKNLKSDIGKTNEEISKEDNKSNGGDTKHGVEALDENADLEGSVYDFTETGFSLSPAKTYEDGGGVVMEQAAPGSEDKDELVSVTYSNNCIFQILVMDVASLKEVSREDTTLESIKKQTQVKVYGNCQDTTHWTAERIIIVRWK